MEHRFPYPQPRPGQLEVAEAVADACRKGIMLFINAPTGFGKTVAVIYGLIKAGARRVLYLVRTRNEIEPVLRELKRLGVRSFSFLYSARRMCPLLLSEDLSIDEFWSACRLLRVKGECYYYTRLSEVSEDTIRAILSSTAEWRPAKIVSTISSANLCPFFALRLMAVEAQFVVATYPYGFKEDIFESVFEPLSYNDFVIVVDEAHSLVNIQSMFEVALPLKTLKRAVEEIEKYRLPGELAENLGKLESYVKSISISEGYKRISKDDIVKMLGDPQLWFDAAEEVRAAKLRERLEGDTDVQLSVALFRVASFAKAAADQGYNVYVKAGGSGAREVVATPVSPSIVVSRPLNEAKAVILLSGTMLPEELLKPLLGVNRETRYYDVELLLGSTLLKPRGRVIVVEELSSRMTERGPEMFRRYAYYLLESFKCAKGAILAVFPSYEFMLAVIRELNSLGLNKEEMVVEGRLTRVEDVQEALSKNPHMVINAVAGGKLVEGVEYVGPRGSLLSVVFIAGVPYPRPDDHLYDLLEVASRETFNPRIVRSMLYDFLATLRVRQAVGRAFRSDDDRAVVVLADKRFLRRRLRLQMRINYDVVVRSLDEFAKVLCDYARELNI